MLRLQSYCELLPEPLFQLVCLVDNYRHTVTVYRISGAMASGDSRPKADRSGIHFRNQLQVPWNAPESIMTLDSLGVVVLDTSAVPDFIGLQARNNDAEPTWVLPGRAQSSVRVLMPDDRAAPPSWIWLVRLGLPSEELSALRRQWPVSVVPGMSKRQTELELMRRDCKARFRSHPNGACTYCRRNIKHDMARHVSSFHLDFCQLWRCPVSWCTQ